MRWNPDVCRRGHALTVLNTYQRPGGPRECRECRKEKVEESRWIPVEERLPKPFVDVERVEEVEDVLIEFVGAMNESVNPTDDLAAMLRFGRASDAAETLVKVIATRRAGRAS